MYLPETKTLKNIHQEIFAFIVDFNAIINDKNFKKYFKIFQKTTNCKKSQKVIFWDIDYLSSKAFKKSIISSISSGVRFRGASESV